MKSFVGFLALLVGAGVTSATSSTAKTSPIKTSSAKTSSVKSTLVKSTSAAKVTSVKVTSTAKATPVTKSSSSQSACSKAATESPEVFTYTQTITSPYPQTYTSESAIVSYYTTTTLYFDEVTAISGTTVQVIPAVVTSTSTSFGSVTVSEPTPCNFVPYRSETLYHGPRSTRPTTAYTTTYVATTSDTFTFFTDTTTSIGNRTVTSPEYVRSYPPASISTVTAPAEPTKTEYAGCSKDNFASRDPAGKLLSIPFFKFKDYMSFDKGHTANAEECCRLCFDTPFCVGSLWTYRGSTFQPQQFKPYCTVYTTYNQTGVCDASQKYFEVVADPFTAADGQPVIGSVASNGPCGRIPPAPNVDFTWG